LIYHRDTAKASVAPRIRLFGLPRDWRPTPHKPTRTRVELFSVPARPDVRQIPQLQPEVTALAPEGFEQSPAKTYLLGSFDLESRLVISSLSSDRCHPAQRASSISTSANVDRSDPTAEVLAALLQPPLELLLPPGRVLDWPAPLLPYQQDGVRALLERERLLLADDMGLGKTVQVIAALRILFHRGSAERVLVVCPTAVLRQWEAEFRKWAPEVTVVTVAAPPERRAALWKLPAHVHLVSYDTLRGDVLDLDVSPVTTQTWDVLVLDEASRIKNRDTGISRAAKLVPSKRRWALTGTPLENRIEDLASILEFLLIDPASGRRHLITPSEARALLPEYQLRRRKEDVLKDLPPKQIIELFLELTPAQLERYQQAERDGILFLQSLGDTVRIDNVLTLIMSLKRICNADPVTGQSSKIEDIRQRVHSLSEEGHRALVFSQFTDDRYGVRKIQRELIDFKPVIYTGDMSQSCRNEILKEFNSNDSHKVLVLSLRAGGVGLNLQSASYVFHLDRWWNPAIEDQAESRAHRMGQTHPVTVYRYVCIGTIEERIHQKLEEKRSLFREVVDDVSIPLSQLLSAEELFGLFGLQMPRKRRTAAASQDYPDFGLMSGEDLEHWLQTQLNLLGYDARLTPRSRDGGIDILATRADEIGIETHLLIQCKNTSAPTGVEVVREVRGAVPERCPGATPIVACPAGFSAEAQDFARRNGVRLWTAKDLVELWEATSTVPVEPRSSGD